MVKNAIKWAKRLALLAAVGAVVRRVLDSKARSGQAGSEPVPTIGGDTWPPVPTKPSDKA